MTSTQVYEQITKLLDEAAQDAAISPENFHELLEDVSAFCEAGLESLDEDGDLNTDEGTDE